MIPYTTQILDCTRTESEATHIALNQAISCLRNGELVAFPTETVYGLGARVFDAQQVERIFSVKRRPNDNPLIAHISDISQIELLARSIPDVVSTLTDAFFPGALTLVLPKHPSVPTTVSAGLDSIAFRMPDHPIALQLIRAIGEPLVAPSANRSGRPSPTSATAVYEDLHGEIPIILDGGTCRIGLESTVLSLLEDTPRILRFGVITKEKIEKVLGYVIGIPESNHIHHSPGTRHKHYAPHAEIILLYSQSEVEEFKQTHSHMEYRVLSYQPQDERNNLHSYNEQTYYAQLRSADKDGIACIAIVINDTVKNNRALYDRIVRSAGKTG